MRIWRRLLLMVITLSFVTCNMKKEPSIPIGLEVSSCLQGDITSHYPTEIEGDSIVIAYYASDTVGSTSLHSTEVATKETVPHSNVNYPKQETKMLEQVAIFGEVLKPTEIPAVEKVDKVETVDIIDMVDVVDVGGDVDTINSIALVDTIDLANEFVAIEDSVGESYLIRRGMIHRDATKALFLPKGQWILGGQVGWNQWSYEDISYLLFENLSFKCHSFVVSPYLGYSFTNNLMAGYRFSYKRGYLNVGEVGLGLGDGLSLSINDFYSVYHSYKNSLFLRSYIPIGESKIFGLLGELQLNYSFTEGKCSMGYDDLLRGVYQNTHTLGLALSGGLVVFLTDFAAAEVMLNVGGCDYKWGRQNIKEIDEKDRGNLNQSSADFRVDLFSIKLGLTFYL